MWMQTNHSADSTNDWGVELPAKDKSKMLKQSHQSILKGKEASISLKLEDWKCFIHPFFFLIYSAAVHIGHMFWDLLLKTWRTFRDSSSKSQSSSLFLCWLSLWVELVKVAAERETLQKSEQNWKVFCFVFFCFISTFLIKRTAKGLSFKLLRM